MKFLKNNWFTILVVVLLFSVEPAFAGPGGFIAKGLFKSFWGKILLGILTIVLLPFILYVYFTEKIAVMKNKKILLKLSATHKNFNWIDLEKEFSHIVRRVYIAWAKEDMAEVKEYVNNWYWRNQQIVNLDYWKSQNLKNVSRLRTLEKVNPLYLEFSSEENLNGTRIAIRIDVEAEDYLLDIETNKIIEGKKGYQDLDYVWFFKYEDGKWLLDDIRQGASSLGFAKLANVIPANVAQQIANPVLAR